MLCPWHFLSAKAQLFLFLVVLLFLSQFSYLLYHLSHCYFSTTVSGTENAELSRDKGLFVALVWLLWTPQVLPLSYHFKWMSESFWDELLDTGLTLDILLPMVGSAIALQSVLAQGTFKCVPLASLRTWRRTSQTPWVYVGKGHLRMS